MGCLVSSKEEMKGVWKTQFECLMNGGTVGEAIVMETGGKRVCAESI